MPGSNRELFNHAHYNVIAKRIREARAICKNSGLDSHNVGAQAALDMLVRDLGAWFAEDNPRFEMDTWLKATETESRN